MSVSTTRTAGAFVVPFAQMGEHVMVLFSSESSHSDLHLLGGKPDIADYYDVSVCAPVFASKYIKGCAMAPSDAGAEAKALATQYLAWQPELTLNRELREELDGVSDLLLRSVLAFPTTPYTLDTRVRPCGESVLEAVYFVDSHPQALLDLAAASPDTCVLRTVDLVTRDELSEIAAVALCDLMKKFRFLTSAN